MYIVYAKPRGQEGPKKVVAIFFSYNDMYDYVYWMNDFPFRENDYFHESFDTRKEEEKI